MKTFAIQRKSDGQYLFGNKTFVEKINNARKFELQAEAESHMKQWFDTSEGGYVIVSVPDNRFDSFNEQELSVIRKALWKFQEVQNEVANAIDIATWSLPTWLSRGETNSQQLLGLDVADKLLGEIGTTKLYDQG